MPRPFVAGFLFAWLGSYEDVQNAAITLLYMQVFIGLFGVVGPTFTGVIVADVVVALFGLVAVASGYQTLGRTYAGLLAVMLVLDAVWLTLFAPHIWSTELTSPWIDHPLVAAAVLAELLCHVITTALRLISTLLWMQMYRLGLSSDLRLPTAGTTSSEIQAYLSDYDSFGMPSSIGAPYRTSSALGYGPPGAGSGMTSATPDLSPRFVRQRSVASDEFLGSSIFHPSSFASLGQADRLQNYLAEEGSGSGSGSASNSSGCISLPSHPNSAGSSYEPPMGGVPVVVEGDEEALLQVEEESAQSLRSNPQSRFQHRAE